MLAFQPPNETMIFATIPNWTAVLIFVLIFLFLLIGGIYTHWLLTAAFSFLWIIALGVWQISAWGESAHRSGVLDDSWKREVVLDTWESKSKEVRWIQEPRGTGKLRSGPPVLNGPLLTVVCANDGSLHVFLSGETSELDDQIQIVVVPDKTTQLAEAPNAEILISSLMDAGNNGLRVVESDQMFTMLATAPAMDSELWIAPAGMGEITYRYDTDHAARRIGGADCDTAIKLLNT